MFSRFLFFPTTYPPFIPSLSSVVLRRPLFQVVVVLRPFEEKRYLCNSHQQIRMVSSSTILEDARSGLKHLVNSGSFDRVLDKVEVISAGHGRVTAEVVLDKSHTNRGGFAHGGFLATLVDSISTLAVMSDTSKEGDGSIPTPGVSIDLNVQFMSPGNVGSTLLIEAETLKKGQTMVYLTVNILDRNTRRLIARGSHIKFIARPKL